MIVTIKKLIETGGREAIIAMGSHFSLSDIETIELCDGGKSYVFFVSDPKTKLQVPCTWTQKDEDDNTTEWKIRVAKSLIENGVHSLQDIIEYKTKGHLS